MATFLDVSGLAAFTKIFVFILVLVVMYMVIANSKFGGAKWIAWVIAFVVGIFVVLSDFATDLIRFIAPWVAVLTVFFIFASAASSLFGGMPGEWHQYKWGLFVLMAIIIIAALMFNIRNKVTVPGDIDEDGNEIKDDNYTKTANFIFHPKFLGVFFLLLVAIFTVALMAGKT